MRLTVWLLGVEVFTISTDLPEPGDAPQDSTERHAGQFEIGFPRRTDYDTELRT